MIAPALALAGGTVLALRLLQAGGKAGDRLAARGRRLTAALASWQISRQPIRQGGAALLIVLATATVTLALAHGRAGPAPTTTKPRSTPAPTCGWRPASRSRRPRPHLVQLPGVRHAMPVASFTGAATNSETIAVDSAQAASVSLLRPDQSALPAAALFAKIGPAGRRRESRSRPHGEIRLTARLGPASLRLAAATVSVAVEDADGDVYGLDAGTLPPRPGSPADRHPGQSAAGRTAATGVARAIYPLRLTGSAWSTRCPRTTHARRPPSAWTACRRPGDGPDRRRGAARLRPWPRPPNWQASGSRSRAPAARPACPPSPRQVFPALARWP